MFRVERDAFDADARAVGAGLLVQVGAVLAVPALMLGSAVVASAAARLAR